jgi:pimeloyl-ACP methyl ester carboxylesterase
MRTDLVDVNGQRLEVARVPAARAGLTPLVWLHEGLGCVALWRDFPARVAAATGAETVAYSRPGYGRSSPRTGPFGIDYLHDEALTVLPALLRRLGLGRPLLVGHSDGASIALIYAASGEPCAGVVAMAPHTFVEEKALIGIVETGEAFRSGDLRARLARHHDDPDGVFRAWHDIWLDPAFRAWDIRGLLPAITAPILVVQGEDDEYATPAQVEAIKEAVCGQCETVLLPGCRHSPHRDQPRRTLELIERFVMASARREEGSDG